MQKMTQKHDETWNKIYFFTNINQHLTAEIGGAPVQWWHSCIQKCLYVCT
jgi:general stress protein 26